MSADTQTLDSALVEHLLAEVRADASLQELLGDSARIFDGETEGAVYPYVLLERHERLDKSVTDVACAEHRFQFASLSQQDGQRGARRLLSTLRIALERVSRTLEGQTIVLIQPTYSDAMRTRGRHLYRGVLRVRVHTEET